MFNKHLSIFLFQKNYLNESDGHLFIDFIEELTLKGKKQPLIVFIRMTIATLLLNIN